jgi:UDP-N-acetylglucosamine 2-epimerase (non-hydrolysing)
VTLHPTTRKRLLALGLLDELSAQPNVTLHQRFNFVDWISVCRTAEFVITDGGSNQEELSYLGVPTLILRNETERQEGLGETALLSRFDGQAIKDFLERPTKYRRSPTGSDAQPSQRIIEVIRAA